MITGSINLAALKYVNMEKKGKDGKPLKGMFIPLEANYLQEHSSGGVYLNIVGFEMKEVKDYATHIVKQSFSKKERELMEEEILKNLPILGNLKTNSGPVSGADNNAANGDVFDSETDDDLPF